MKKEKISKWIEEKGNELGLSNPEILLKKEGESNHNFILKSNQGKYVLRASKQISRDNRLQNEAEKLEFLEDQGVKNLPRKIFYSENSDIGPLLVETFVGKEDLEADSMSEERIKSLARKTAEIHSLPIKKFENFTGKKFSNKKSLKKVFEEDFRDYSKRPYREYLDIAEKPDHRIKKFYKKQKKLLKEFSGFKVEQGLIHGDLGFNIRATGDKVFIIDWEYSRIGYPANEILYCFEHEKMSNEQREVFLKEYQKYRSLGKEFEKVREIYPGFLAFNDMIWAAKRAEIEPKKEEEHLKRMEKKMEKVEKFHSKRE